MVAVELAGRDVDRDVDTPLIEVPFLRLAAGLLNHPAPDVDDELRLLEQGDECVGLHEPAARVLPAQQRFDSEDDARLELEDGLVHEVVLAAFERAAEVEL